MKKKTSVYFVLDKTGSMADYKQQTIDGFNEYIKGLQEQKGYNFTLVLFNSESIEKRHDNQDIELIPFLNTDTYIPSYTTPLYDAIGQTIIEADKKHKKKSKVLFVVLTDGLENASREYSQEQIFKMITEQRNKGWEFVYLGANQDAWAIGVKIGVDPTNTSSFNQAKTGQTFRAAYAATVSYRSGNIDGLIPKDVSEKIK